MENVIKQIVLIRMNKTISLQQFIPLSEAEIQGLLHPAKPIFSCVVSVSPAALSTV
jgi:hypothetical protein